MTQVKNAYATDKVNVAFPVVIPYLSIQPFLKNDWMDYSQGLANSRLHAFSPQVLSCQAI
ncbi:hypothetical protein GCM10007160_10440 [Litchfieldella qijiaojingensis]|uniref:Uncharacterized protein n=1 Tax=Litchfieldella qijiaojingensis TaxID=980347 RepID=A0ABQ2YIP8_9GAMM|nr:hypothetical protein GCM10007160_10440 [Halomonas qijiaojingensis]